MSPASLLVTFCNQLTSPRCSGGFIKLDSDGWFWLPLADLDISDGDNGGLCGACTVGQQVVLAAQSTPPRLLRFDPQTGSFTASCILTACTDVHSIVHHEGALYVVSTGSNEVYRVPVDAPGFGEPSLHWRYPGVGSDRDRVHLNGLTVSPRGLIASCFGPQEADGSWSNDGSVFFLEPFGVIRDGLSHPHSPLCCGDRLFLTESRGNRVHAMKLGDDGQWRQDLSVDLGGYPRGLACQNNKLWVGLSAERRVSRSRQTANPGVAAGRSAAIACIDLGSGEITRQRELPGLGNEIYDLLLLDYPGPFRQSADVLIERIANMQAMADAVRVDYVERIRGLAEMEQKKDALEKLVSELRAELERERQVNDVLEREVVEMRARISSPTFELESERAFAAKLGEQLRIMDGSRLWRAAQYLRRLAGRPPHVVDMKRPPLPPKNAEVSARPMDEIFREIFVNNVWGSEASRSGTGSDSEQTAVIREALPRLLSELDLRTMLDIPCGDYHWMRITDLDVDYIGADVVPDLISANNARYANARRRFQVLDIASDDLPCVDLVFCRDLLVHFSFTDALRAVDNLKRSGSTYLLTTTFTNRTANVDIETGQWRALNLQLPPFGFPPPVRLINENCTEWGTDWADKSLGLWRLCDLGNGA